MKKLIAAISVCIYCTMTWAYFPTNISSATVEVTKVTGNFDSYRFKWIGQDDQEVRLYFTNVGIPFTFSATDQLCSRISRAGTIYVDLLPTNNHFVTNGNYLYYTISRTNIPPNGNYQMETWMYTGANTNMARTLAQGEVTISKSLYQDTNAYPFPSTISNMTDYLTITNAVLTYAQITNVVLRAAVTESTSNYVNFHGGASLDIGIKTNYAAASSALKLAEVLTNGANAAGLGATNFGTVQAVTSDVTALKIGPNTATNIATSVGAGSSVSNLATTFYVTQVKTDIVEQAVSSNTTYYYTKTYVDALALAGTNVESWSQFAATQNVSLGMFQITSLAAGNASFEGVNVVQMNASNAVQDTLMANIGLTNDSTLAALALEQAKNTLQDNRLTSNETSVLAAHTTNAAQALAIAGATTTNGQQSTYIQAAHDTNALQQTTITAFGVTNETQNYRLLTNEVGLTAAHSTNATQATQITGLYSTQATHTTQITGLYSTQATHTTQLAGLYATQALNTARSTAAATTNALQELQVAGLYSTQATHTAQIAGINVTNELAVTNIVNVGTFGTNGAITRTGQVHYVVFPQPPVDFGGYPTNPATTNAAGIQTNYWSWNSTNWYALNLGSANGQTLQFFLREDGEDWNDTFSDDIYVRYFQQAATTNPVLFERYQFVAGFADADNYRMSMRTIDQAGAPLIGPTDGFGPIVLPALPPETASRNTINAVKFDFLYTIRKPGADYILWIGNFHFYLDGELTPR